MSETLEREELWAGMDPTLDAWALSLHRREQELGEALRWYRDPERQDLEQLRAATQNEATALKLQADAVAQERALAAKERRIGRALLWFGGTVLVISGLILLWVLGVSSQIQADLHRSGITLSGTHVEDLR